MSYQEFRPHPALVSYIDAYWSIKTDKVEPAVNRILPDGCIDIIISLGSDFLTEEGGFTMRSGKTYLVGTMTLFIDTIRMDYNHLIGIRFKPLGFSHFYKFSSLHEIANSTIEFNASQIPSIHELTHNTIAILDGFFLRRLSNRRHSLSRILADIETSKGQITVRTLAKEGAIGDRQLERSFKEYLGVTPKEYINFVRYKNALEKIRNNVTRKSLGEIAFDAGYYDHSHLTNEIRKYSGLLPSELL